MKGKSIDNILAVQERGTIFLRFDGPAGSVRVVSKAGQSIRMEAGKTYEMDCRNPILMSYALKQQCVTLEAPRTKDIKEQIGKKVSGKNLQNTFTALKRKTADAEPVKPAPPAEIPTGPGKDELDILLEELERDGGA